MTHGIVPLLLSKGHFCYRPRRTGERKGKTVYKCSVDANLSVLNLDIVKKGEKDIPGLTNTTVSLQMRPKRANRIRKFFNLSNLTLILTPVFVRKLSNIEGKKPRFNESKIQHLVTLCVLYQKCWYIALKKHCTKKSKEDTVEHAKLMTKSIKEAKEKYQEEIAEV